MNRIVNDLNSDFVKIGCHFNDDLDSNDKIGFRLNKDFDLGQTLIKIGLFLITINLFSFKFWKIWIFGLKCQKLSFKTSNLIKSMWIKSKSIKSTNFWSNLIVFKYNGPFSTFSWRQLDLITIYFKIKVQVNFIAEAYTLGWDSPSRSMLLW